jgi:hypothetical protein
MECHANNYNKIGGSNDQVSKLKLLMPITLITIQHKAKPPNLIAACEQTVHLIIIVSIFWVHRQPSSTFRTLVAMLTTLGHGDLLGEHVKLMSFGWKSILL